MLIDPSNESDFSDPKLAGHPCFRESRKRKKDNSKKDEVESDGKNQVWPAIRPSPTHTRAHA